MNESIQGASTSRGYYVLFLILTVVLGIAGLAIQQHSLGTVRNIRRLERIPRSPIDALLGGPVSIRGQVAQLPGTPLLKSKWTQTPCVWVRAIKEEEHTDSDGNSHWDTVYDQTSYSHFLIRDKTGKVQIQPTEDADFEIAPTWVNETDSLRYTEYRIDLDETIFAAGLFKDDTHGGRIIFNQPGEYVPILSNQPIAGTRAGLAVSATLWVVVSLLSVSAACVCLMIGCKLHNALGFAVIVGSVETLFLLSGGLMMMSADLTAAGEILVEQEREAKELVTSGMQELKIPWSGNWTDQEAFAKAAKAGAAGMRLNRIRSTMAARAARSTVVLHRFPQSLVAWYLDLKPPPTFLAAGESATTNTATIEPAVPNFLWPTLIVLLGILVAAIGLLGGFSDVKLKRLIENVPTRRATEVAIGITELEGTLKHEKKIELLDGPLTHKPCVWYHYKVQEWHGSGKSRHLKTIEDRTRTTVFLCQDDSGEIPIAPKDARIISGRNAKHKSGKKIFTEQSLRPGDPIYILGSAEVDPASGDSLRIEKGPQNLPFLISNLPKYVIMTREIVAGFWLLAFGIAASAAVLLGLLLYNGRVAAIDQLSAACASIIAVCVVVTAIMYNDLVFLKKRVAWAASNIDVALKKRADLVPQLETIAKGYMKYEKEVQPALAALRTAWSQKNMDAAQAGDSVQASQKATNTLLGLREQYPALKADSLTDSLMRNIVALENEIAARRDGYNATLEIYRTRIHSIPEVVLAKIFHFKDLPFLAWKGEIHPLAKLDFKGPERPEHELGKQDVTNQ